MQPIENAVGRYSYTQARRLEAVRTPRLEFLLSMREKGAEESEAAAPTVGS